MKLYNYQREGVALIEKWNGRVLLADEQGLGKTAQALCWTDSHRHLKPVLIVCQATLKLVWKNELHKWIPDHKVVILEGEQVALASDIQSKELLVVLKQTDFVPLTVYVQQFVDSYIIINYDILSYWLDVLAVLRPQVLILDECAYIKNPKALRTQAVLAIAQQIEHIIAISGTPVLNRPEEFFNVLHMLRPNMFPSWWNFVKRYCDAQHRKIKVGWYRDPADQRMKPKFKKVFDTSGASNLSELYLKLSRSFMIRRLKAEVQKELPKKIRTVIPLPINLSKYQQVEDNFGSSPLSYFNNIISVAVQGKMAAVIDWIADTIENEKLVVFCRHHIVVDKLMSKFKKVAVKLTGKESLKQREQAIELFQNNPDTRLFVGTIDNQGNPAGVGITLTAASNIAFAELPWTPSVCVQAEDRCHRIGQTRTVNIYYLIADQTIEQDIMSIIDRKRETITKIMDGKNPEQEEMLQELIKIYKERKHA